MYEHMIEKGETKMWY